MNAGTDLLSAYSEPVNVEVSNIDFSLKPVKSVEYSATIDDQPRHSQQRMPKQENEQEQQTMIYDQSELLQNINDSKLKEQMKVLKEEIEQQKVTQQLKYRENYEKTSFIDSFIMKKREMARFVSVSLIIIFALSLHSTISEIITEYIDANDLTKNKILIIKFMYPLLILLMAWVLKTLRDH
jgi:ABC-type bacteriocin/lantibiotic exporter with double-glycine peptidase domain